MRKAIGVLLGMAVLAGCGADKDTRDIHEDARDIAAVEKMNQTPFKPIRPQPFTADDIAQYDLARNGCTFRPGDNPDEPALFVAQQDRGFLKIEGKLKPLSVKGGSAELPSGAHAAYIGMENWVELVAQAGSEGKAASGGQAWPSRLVIHDASQRVAFNSVGLVSCVGAAAPKR